MNVQARVTQPCGNHHPAWKRRDLSHDDESQKSLVERMKIILFSRQCSFASFRFTLWCTDSPDIFVLPDSETLCAELQNAKKCPHAPKLPKGMKTHGSGASRILTILRTIIQVSTKFCFHLFSWREERIQTNEEGNIPMVDGNVEPFKEVITHWGENFHNFESFRHHQNTLTRVFWCSSSGLQLNIAWAKSIYALPASEFVGQINGI